MLALFSRHSRSALLMLSTNSMTPFFPVATLIPNVRRLLVKRSKLEFSYQSRSGAS